MSIRWKEELIQFETFRATLSAVRHLTPLLAHKSASSSHRTTPRSSA